MKNVFKFLSVAVVSAILFSSCSKDEIQPTAPTTAKAALSNETTNELKNEEHLQLGKAGFQSATAAASYTTSPTQNTWTAVSTVATGTSCAVFQSGLKAKVIAVSGNKITIQLQKGNGSTFGSAGTAYIKATSLCGNIAGTSAIQSSFYYANVDFWCTFSSGTVSFSPSITLSNGVRMYAPMITVTAKSDVVFEKQLVNGSNYSHYYQKNSPYYGGYACIPTSYMIARKIVYPNKAFSTDELVRISKGMNLQSWGTSITNASNFAKSDIGSCNLTVQANGDVNWAKNYIKDAINANRPLLAVTNLRSLHIVTIVGIKLTNSDDTGIIYYIDPYDTSANVRTYKLSTFLSSMRSASSYGYHNLLRIGC